MKKMRFSMNLQNQYQQFDQFDKVVNRTEQQKKKTCQRLEN